VPKILVTYGRDQKIPPYVAALEACGLTASDLVAVKPEKGAAVPGLELLDGAEGVVLTGGNDVDPHLYGQEPLPDAHLDTSFPERDRMELALVGAARARRVPVLAICRGLQVVNVALGGTLWQDLPSQAGVDVHDRATAEKWPLDRRAHPVEAVGPEVALRSWLGDEPVEVNSRHHQAVRQPGRGLVTSAIARDGVVEAMASEDPAWWMWGVQWHPENLIEDPRQLALFTTFLAAVEAGR